MKVFEFVEKALTVPYKEDGRDFKGWDCWGLVVCFYALCLNEQIADFSVSSFSEREILVKSIVTEARNWREVSLKEKVQGNLIFFRPLHVGIFIEKDKMLHTDKGVGTCIERFNGIGWRDRIIGVWKYE